ncbi:MAG: HAMP domain-containing sensor histidine kinase, partial [Fuerstiella sp.]
PKTPPLKRSQQQKSPAQVYLAAPPNDFKAFQQSSGWFLWYWDRGLNLISWQRRPSGQIVGGALVRARWMSDLVARLPETIETQSNQLPAGDATRSRLPTRIQLVNASAETVYQWGSYEPTSDQQALCEVALAEPLGSWRLKCFVPSEQLTSGTGRSVYFGLFSSLIAIAVVVAATALFFLRDYSRDMKQAQQQVSFVNQVSHELKTPLTNIRMYAELLESDLDRSTDPATEKPRQRLQIILSEGQRLTRLIGNVLTFARQQRKTLQLHETAVSPDEVIRQIVDRFRPAMVDQQVEVQLNLHSNQKVQLDCDFLEQILGNLISNVEKYAASGGQLCIESKQDAGQLILDVKDCGPGILPALAEHIFQPFARVTNDVSYAAGTGIGLSIARELSRLHGGDLLLKESTRGCWFRANLKCKEPS